MKTDTIQETIFEWQNAFAESRDTKKLAFNFRMKTPEIMIIKLKMKCNDGGSARDGGQDSSEDSGR